MDNNNDESDFSNRCTKRGQQQQQQSVDQTTASNVEDDNLDQNIKPNATGDNDNTNNQNAAYLPWMGRLLWTGTSATASVGATAIKSVASGTYTVGSTVVSYIPGSSWFKGKETNDSIEKSNLETDPLASPTSINENSNNLNATGTSASSKSASTITSKWSLKQKNKSD